MKYYKYNTRMCIHASTLRHNLHTHNTHICIHAITLRHNLHTHNTHITLTAVVTVTQLAVQRGSACVTRLLFCVFSITLSRSKNNIINSYLYDQDIKTVYTITH